MCMNKVVAVRIIFANRHKNYCIWLNYKLVQRLLHAYRLCPQVRFRPDRFEYTHGSVLLLGSGGWIQIYWGCRCHWPAVCMAGSRHLSWGKIKIVIKMCPLVAHLFYANGRTDRRIDMAKLIVAFCNVANARKTFNCDSVDTYWFKR